MALGALGGGLHWANLEYGIPSLDPNSLSLKEQVRGSNDDHYSLIQALPDGHPLVAAWYPSRERLEDIVLIMPQAIIFADQGQWTGDGWKLSNVHFNRRRETVRPFEQQALESWVWVTDQGPRELTELNLDDDRLTRSQLLEKSVRFPLERRLKVAAADRLSRPVTSMCLLLVILPLALVRGGAIRAAVQAAVATLLYFVLTGLCLRLGSEGWLPVPLAVWSPAVLAGLVALPRWWNIST